MTVSGTDVVAIWRDHWLPYSETFIRDQIEHYQEWTPYRVGYARLADPLVEPDYAPGGVSAPARLYRRLFGLRWGRREFAQQLLSANAQLIHAHFGPGGLSAMPLAADLRIPLLTTFHGQDAFQLGGLSPFLNRRYARMLPGLFEASTKLIAVSTFNARRLFEAGAPSSKIEVIRTGTAVPTSPPSAHREGILFVGRLIAQKGADVLLRAVAALPGSLRRTQVTIVGSGPEEPALRHLAEELHVNALFVGALEHQAVIEAMRGAAIFCGPSTKPEGFGMVYAEAAAAATPAVASDHGGAQEAIEHEATGLLVQPGRVDALASALASLLSDEKAARRMGLQGHSLARAEFDIRRQSREVERLYSAVIQSWVP